MITDKMTDSNRLTDLVERLRDKAFKRCGPTIEAGHTKTDEWLAADAIEELMAALKPFAEMADEYDAAFPRPLNICLAEYPEDYPLWCQARAVLGEKE